MNNNLKNYLNLSLIIALLVFSYGVLQFVSSYSKAAEPASLRSFSVSAEGEVIAIPDIAQFSFGIITQGGVNLNALQGENSKKVTGAIAFVKERGIEEKDITTKNYTIEPRYQYYTCARENGPCPPPEIVGYTVQQNILIKVRDFGKLGELLSGVVENGANTISQLSFTIEDPAKLQNEAREKAIARAREKAQAIAKAGEFEIGRLLSIQENLAFPYPVSFLEAKGGAVPAPVPSIEPGSQEIEVQVTLTYEIK